MFTCPEKDIHSIYLDGELPQNFTKDYEAHIASCQKCRATLEKMRALHNILVKDAASMDLSKDFMKKSYERLQSRMRFTNIVKMSQPEKHIVQMKHTFIPMAAAAAAVLAIMLPLKMNSSQAVAPMQDAEVLPVISRVQELKPIADNDVLVEGGIKNVALHTQDLEPNSRITSTANNKPLELKASNFEVLKTEEPSGEMTIRLTKLVDMNTMSAANVSFDQFSTPDFLK